MATLSRYVGFIVIYTFHGDANVPSASMVPSGSGICGKLAWPSWTSPTRLHAAGTLIS